MTNQQEKARKKRLKSKVRRAVTNECKLLFRITCATTQHAKTPITKGISEMMSVVFLVNTWSSGDKLNPPTKMELKKMILTKMTIKPRR